LAHLGPTDVDRQCPFIEVKHSVSVSFAILNGPIIGTGRERNGIVGCLRGQHYVFHREAPISSGDFGIDRDQRQRDKRIRLAVQSWRRCRYAVAGA
jgi:hypothetical protein